MRALPSIDRPADLSVWLFLGVILILFVAASRMDPAPSTVDYLYLRPIDVRTRALSLTTALTGLTLGWVAGAVAMNRRNTPVWSVFAASWVIIAGVLMMGGIPLGTAQMLGLLGALEAATVAIFMSALVRTRRGVGIAAGTCLIVSTVALLATLDTSLAFVGILIPTFWTGDLLTAVQLGQETQSAGAVAVSLHLLPLTVAVGLRAIAREER